MDNARPDDRLGSLPSASSATFRIFDRERTSHPWGTALAELSAEADDRLRWAVAYNWQMDHRVSEERERDDLVASGHFAEVAKAEDWWEARYLYFRGEICRNQNSARGEISAYLRSPNRANPVTARPAGFDRLVHVGCLNSIVWQILRGGRAERTGMALQALLGRGLPHRPFGASGSDWFNVEIDRLARTLVERGVEVAQQAAGLLVDALGETEPPWWACFAEEIRSVLEAKDPFSLCCALGLGHRRPGDRLLVWEYPVSEVSRLYRPTAIEANDSPFHYPSPPSYPWGVTMPLAAGLPACREVLHPPLRGERAIRWCTGDLLFLDGSLPGPDGGTLRALRSSHRQALRGEFATDDCAAWIDRHPES